MADEVAGAAGKLNCLRATWRNESYSEASNMAFLLFLEDDLL